jgi:hypothetical protein
MVGSKVKARVWSGTGLGLGLGLGLGFAACVGDEVEADVHESVFVQVVAGSQV